MSAFDEPTDLLLDLFHGAPVFRLCYPRGQYLHADVFKMEAAYLFHLVKHEAKLSGIDYR